MDTSASGFTRIDIARLLRSQAPKIAPFVPKLIIRKLERLLHVAEINDFVEGHYHEEPMEFVGHCLQLFDLSYVVEGESHIASCIDKRPIIVANHPLGGPESVVLMKVVGAHGHGVRMVAKGVLGEIGPLRPLLVPIPTKRDHSLVAGFCEAFTQEFPIIIFPAGYCARPLSNGVTFDFEWHNTFVKMARRYGRPVLPVHIEGANSRRFYRLSALRRFLGIRTSLESLCLPDEMFRQRGKTIRLTAGEPIDPALFDPAVADPVWADRVRSHVYLLGKDGKSHFDPALEPVLPLR